MTTVQERAYNIATQLQDLARDVAPSANAFHENEALRQEVEFLVGENESLLRDLDDLTEALEMTDQVLEASQQEVIELRQQVAELEAKLDNKPKLSDTEVRVIRQKWRSGFVSKQELADEYGVNRSTIHRIITGEYHKGV